MSAPGDPRGPAAPILIVDDDREIREIVSEVLADAGYAVIAARHGAEALELLETVTPALILLDLNMPVMDGVELLRRREASGAPRIPTVVMSAMHLLEERIADLIVEEALAKPVQLARLLAVVERYGARAKAKTA